MVLISNNITPSLPYGCIPSQVSFLMSLFRNAVRQENRKARFKAGAEHGVDAKRITSSCERCSLSVGIISIRSKKPFGFSFILRSRYAVWIDARKVTFRFPPSHLGNSNKFDCSRFGVG